APAEERARLAVLLAQRVQIVSAVLGYVADEFPGLVSGSLPEDVLQQLRADMLDISQRGSALVSSANRVTNALVEQTLTAIADRQAEGAREASAALGELRRRADNELFPADVLVPVVTRLRSPRPARPDLDVPSVHLERLIQLRPRLQALAVRATAVQQEWHDVTPASGERGLFLSSRFSPIAGSQFFNFAGFLDRPLRELDYGAGVYDGVHELAAAAGGALPRSGDRGAVGALRPQAALHRARPGAPLRRRADLRRVPRRARRGRIPAREPGDAARALGPAAMGDQHPAQGPRSHPRHR